MHKCNTKKTPSTKCSHKFSQIIKSFTRGQQCATTIIYIKDPVNYRPITNLKTISKILERLANKQLQEHPALSPKFKTFESAYQLFHSTETAMTKVVNDLLPAVDGGKP